VTRGSGRARSERGASAVEMAMYMPLLMFVIFLAVQMSLVYLGNQAATATAREAARVARVTGSAAQGDAAGSQYAANIGQGVLEDVRVTVTYVGDDRVRAVVSGRAQQLVPVLVPRVSQEVEGPIEEFRQD